MTTFARSTLLRPRAARTATKLLVALIAAALACVLYATVAAPADAIVETVEGNTVGLQPRVVGTLQWGPFLENAEKEETKFDPLPETFENPDRQPRGARKQRLPRLLGPHLPLPQRLETLIDGFIENVNQAENSNADVFAVDEQYTDKPTNPPTTASTYKGSYVDTTPYPPSGCTDPHPLKPDLISKVGPITCLTAAADQGTPEVLHRTAANCRRG